MFWRKPQPDLLPETVQSLSGSIFHLDSLTASLWLPQDWRVVTGRDTYKDLITPNFDQATDRLKLTHRGVLQLHLADIRPLPPYPTQLTIIRAAKDIQTRNAIAQMLTTLNTLALDLTQDA